MYEYKGYIVLDNQLIISVEKEEDSKDAKAVKSAEASGLSFTGYASPPISPAVSSDVSVATAKCALLRSLQLREDSHDVKDHASDGGWTCGSRVES